MAVNSMASAECDAGDVLSRVDHLKKNTGLGYLYHQKPNSNYSKLLPQTICQGTSLFLRHAATVAQGTKSHAGPRGRNSSWGHERKRNTKNESIKAILTEKSAAPRNHGSTWNSRTVPGRGPGRSHNIGRNKHSHIPRQTLRIPLSDPCGCENVHRLGIWRKPHRYSSKQ